MIPYRVQSKTRQSQKTTCGYRLIGKAAINTCSSRARLDLSPVCILYAADQSARSHSIRIHDVRELCSQGHSLNEEFQCRELIRPQNRGQKVCSELCVC
jgi:hypothetical protein